MSWIYNTFFGWINKVEEYRDNHGKSNSSHPEFSKKNPEIKFLDTDSEAVDFATETDLMIADLVPPPYMKRDPSQFVNKYYLSWHSIINETDGIPGIPGIVMFDTFEDAMREYEKRIDAPFGKTFVHILWTSGNDSLKKLQIGYVKNYSDYKRCLDEINSWVKSNLYNAKSFVSDSP